MVRRRLRREPVAYILGSKGFRHIELAVDRRVLIPRPESELLVEVALELRPAHGSRRRHRVGRGRAGDRLRAPRLRGDGAATPRPPPSRSPAPTPPRLGLADRVRFLEGSVPPGESVRSRRRQPPLRGRVRALLAGPGDHPLGAAPRRSSRARRPRRLPRGDPPPQPAPTAVALEVGRRPGGGRRRAGARRRLRGDSRLAATSPASSGSWSGRGERDGLHRARRRGPRHATALERCIASGGVALFPADGLYGLACDPLNGAAIERIHRIKGRDDGKPSAVMYFSPLAMRELIESLGPRTREAVGALMPGPVTLVVANPARRYPLACREDPERPRHPPHRRSAGRCDVPGLPDQRQPQRRSAPRFDSRRSRRRSPRPSTSRSTAGR